MLSVLKLWPENKAHQNIHARKAIETYFDNLEDAAVAASAFAEFLLDSGKASLPEEVRHRLGLEG